MITFRGISGGLRSAICDGTYKSDGRSGNRGGMLMTTEQPTGTRESSGFLYWSLCAIIPVPGVVDSLQPLTSPSVYPLLQITL